MIEFVETSESTQVELIEALKFGVVKPPHAIIAKFQTSGFGSRGNNWESAGENLHFSFCLEDNFLPGDIPSNSISIYFAYIMKEYLESLGSKVWLKWPNDFYINDKKIGGVITTKIKETYICGIGINLTKSPTYADKLDIEASANSLAIGYLELLKNKFLWKQIFSKFLIEFEKSKNFTAHIDKKECSLKDAKLLGDGSILINNKKVYSLR